MNSNRIAKIIAVGMTFSSACVAPSMAQDQQKRESIAITLSPAAPGAERYIPYVDVTIVTEGVQRQAGDKLFRLPLMANTVVTSAKDLQGLVAVDAKGTVNVTVDDVEEDSSNRTRFWVTPRAVDGTVTLKYRVPIDSAAPPISRPQYEMRTENGSFSVAANAFLALPVDDVARDVKVTWDFSSYGEGGRGVSSFGVGNVTGWQALTARKIAGTYFMGGKPGLYQTPQKHFFAAWHGASSFPMSDLMTWASDLYGFYGEFFGYTAESFGVFGRTNVNNPGSGIGLTDSFAFTFNRNIESEELKLLLAHEMLHSWVSSLDDSMDEAGGLDRSWFGEGLAVHYQRALPYRAKLASADEFLADLNETAGRYYTNIKINVPNAEIPDGFWKDTRIRVLPYDRGSLYFALIDAQIKAKSRGNRSLDDLVREMLNTRRAGNEMNEALWRKLLHAELGDKGITDFEGMLAGRTILPDSNAFGPEFRRTTKLLRRFDMGFDMASMLSSPRVIKGLIAGSNAEKAGLRNGDVITNTFSQDGLQGDQNAYVTIKVDRNGEALEFRYQPRGEQVSAYQWVKR